MNAADNIAPVHTFSIEGVMHAVYHAKKGQGLARHDHTYGHITACHAGSIVVRKEGREHIFLPETQPALLVAGEWHEIEALEDGTVFVNIFAEPKG